jgi:crotonobetainyl-CoA:carnitine CoA-transferase CaiB-like acyl-CoA transferase
MVLPQTDPFLSLHAGAYPCYGIYKLNAGQFLAVGAIEAHFWKTFLQEFGLDRYIDQQFDRSNSIKEAIALQLQKMPIEDVQKKVQDNSAGLSLISFNS